jgi:hypothetical protein
VAQAVEAEEALGPRGVTGFGAGRQLAHPAGPAEAVEQARRVGEGQVADGQTEDLMVEEGEGRVRFVEAVQGIRFGLGDVLQEAADVAGLEVAGVALVVEQDQAQRPVGEAFPGPVLAEVRLRDLADEVEETGGAGEGLGRAGVRWT